MDPMFAGEVISNVMLRRPHFEGQAQIQTLLGSQSIVGLRWQSRGGPRPSPLPPGACVLTTTLDQMSLGVVGVLPK